MNAVADQITSSPTNAPAAEQNKLACREHGTWSPGDTAHQGDLILVCLPGLPKSAKARTNRQMAEGETRGSKHVVAGGEVFDADANEVVNMIAKATGGAVKVEPRYAGPVFTGPAVLEHPEHQHQSFPESVTCVVYQRSLDAEEREARSQD